MKYNEFKKSLREQGAQFQSGKGSHFRVTLNGRTTIFLDHGSKEICTKMVALIKKTTRIEVNGGAMFFGESTTMLSYPVNLELDTNHTFLVTFPDIPEAVSVGSDEDEALLNALDALETAIEIYFDEKREVPMPLKPKKGQPVVDLPALVVSKVLLANEMIRQGVRKAELARRLNVHMPQVDRLLDPRHSSKLEAIEAAFRSLGKRLNISVA